MNKNQLASIGLVIGAIFGVSGSIFTDPVPQMILYEISSIGLTVGCALLAVKYFREEKDYVATGFLLLAMAEVVMSGGTALGQEGGQAAFGAGMALYVPAFLFIALPTGFPIWNRITCVAAAVPFAIAAVKIFLGQQVPSTSALPGAGYGLFVLTIIGWILILLKENRTS